MLVMLCQVTRHVLRARDMGKPVFQAPIELARSVVVSGKKNVGNSSRIGFGAKIAKEQAGVNCIQPMRNENEPNAEARLGRRRPDERAPQMSTGQRRVRSELWIGLIFVALLAYALVADWWKEHAVLGWAILGIVLALLGFSFYRFRKFRNWLFGKVRSASDRLIHEPEESAVASTPPRSAVPSLTQNDRDLFIEFMGGKCEYPNCPERNALEIHHIRPREEGGNNTVWNLLVLCPNHHTLAQKNIPPRSRQRLWAQKHGNQRRRLLRSGKWKYR